MEGSVAERHWFAARVRSGHELKMRTRLGDLGIRNYIPSREVTRVRGHKRCKVEAPVIPNLIFLYCTKPQALALANGYGLPLKYLIDHATRTLLEVPTKQLEDFIRVMEEDPATLCPPDQAFEPGQKVRVVAGNLAGVEGEVEMLPNRTFLVISVCGLLRARIQIPRAYVKAI